MIHLFPLKCPMTSLTPDLALEPCGSGVPQGDEPGPLALAPC